MIPLLIVALLLTGTTGTVLASNSARPGDLLYAVDVLAEDVRLSLASDEKVNDLRRLYAQERIDELMSILAEEEDRSDRERVLEAEADVYTNTTLVKVEINGKKTLFTVSATSSPEIAKEIADRFSLSLERVMAVLTVDIEDRAMRASDFMKDDSDDDDTATSTTGTATSTAEITEAEADVFTDLTLVKVEIGERIFTFSLATMTREGVVQEIAKRFLVPASDVEKVLDFEIEDRASRASDMVLSNRLDSKEGTARVESALQTVIDRFSVLGVPANDAAVLALQQALDRIPEDIRARVRVDDDKFEIRARGTDEDVRIRVDRKDGETRIRVKDDSNDSSEDDSNDSFDDSDDSLDDSSDYDDSDDMDDDRLDDSSNDDSNDSDESDDRDESDDSSDDSDDDSDDDEEDEDEEDDDDDDDSDDEEEEDDDDDN